MRQVSRVALLMLGVFVLCSACGAPSPALRAAATAASVPAHPSLTMYSATAHVQPGTPTSLSVSCRPGEQMLGGGFGTSNLFEYAAYIDESYPSGTTTWTIVASAPSSFYDIEVDVYCVPASISIYVHVVQASGSSSATVACPQDTVLLGGGFWGSQPIGMSRPQGNGWLGATAGATLGASIKVCALCATRHIQLGQVVTATFNAHSSTHGYAPSGGNAACPTGQTAVGGGFEGGDLIVGSQTHGSSFAGWSVAAGGDADMTVSAVCVLLQT
jgi:hypothetical protein